jgi:hypothetical protein
MVRKIVILGVMLLAAFDSLQAQAQTCTNSSLNGTYFYLLDGTIATAGGNASYVELGKLIADGSGAVSGGSTASVAGSIATYSLSGSYTVQGNCTGTLTLSVNSQFAETITFQIVSGGRSAVVAFSSSGAVVVGRAYRAASTGQCGNASLTGGYGYLLSGVVSLAASTYLYSDAGQVVSNGSGGITTISVANIGAGASQASGTGTYSIASDCSDTAQVTDQNGKANYIVAVVEGGNVLFMESDGGTTVAGTAQPQSTQSVLPQFVFGGGWFTSLYFTNTTSSAVSFPVNFIGDDGNPLSVPSVGGSSTLVNLAPHGTASILTANAGPLNQGYASVSIPAGVTGYGVFDYSNPNVPHQEAVVPLSDAVATISTLVWDDTNFVTSVGIVNPSPVATTVMITLHDAGGATLGTSSVSLGPKGKTAVVLRNLPGLGAMVGNQGSADFTVASGNVSVLGLRFIGSAFTSIPTTQQ